MGVWNERMNGDPFGREWLKEYNIFTWISKQIIVPGITAQSHYTILPKIVHYSFSIAQFPDDMDQQLRVIFFDFIGYIL